MRRSASGCARRPEALRAHLEEKHVRFHGHLDQFGEPGAAALALLLASRDDMSEIERDAFAAIVRQLGDDPLDARPAAGTGSADGSRPRHGRAARRELPPPAARTTGRALPPLRRRTDAAPATARTRRRRAAERLHRRGAREFARDETKRRAWNRNARASPTSTAATGKRARASISSASRPGSRTDRRRCTRSSISERLRICRRCDEIAYPDPNQSRDQYGRPRSSSRLPLPLLRRERPRPLGGALPAAARSRRSRRLSLVEEKA